MLLCADIIKVVSDNLNVIDLYHLMLINRDMFKLLNQDFRKRLKDHNFYLITHQSDKYVDLIMNVISIFKDNSITVDVRKSGILIYEKQDGFCIKLSEKIFKSFVCSHNIKFSINIYRLNRIAKDITKYDEFYIFKELNDNKINIYIINRFDRKIKINYKINL